MRCSHMCLHGEQRAVRRRLDVVRDMNASKLASAAHHIPRPVHDMAIGENVSECALLAELAVALFPSQPRLMHRVVIFSQLPTFVKYLHGARSVMGSSECRNGHALPA